MVHVARRLRRPRGPGMAWNGDLTALTRVLAELYPDRESAERLVDQAGVPGGLVAYRTRPRDNWHSILREAVNHGKVADVLEAALDDYPEHPGLLAARGAELQPVLGPVPGEREPWHPDQPPETLERLMEEQSSFLPVAFLEVGARRARAVARIERADGECGTGFLVEGRLLVTNHHVLPTADAAAGAGIDFGYQASRDGLAPRRDRATTALDPGSVFVTSPVDEYDVAVVRVADVTEEGIEPLVLRRRDLSALRWANIVQHPDGGPNRSRSTTTSSPTSVRQSCSTTPTRFRARPGRRSSTATGTSWPCTTAVAGSRSRGRARPSSATKASTSTASSRSSSGRPPQLGRRCRL